MSKTLWCKVGIHRWTRYGKPQADDAYWACRRCGKHRSLLWDPDAAHEVLHTGMDDQTKKPSKRLKIPGGPP